MCLCSSQCYVMCVSVSWSSSMFSSWCWPLEIPCAILLVLFILFTACSRSSCLEEAWRFFFMQSHISFKHWFIGSELEISRSKIRPCNATYSWSMHIDMSVNRFSGRVDGIAVLPYKTMIGIVSRQIIPNSPQFLLQALLTSISTSCWVSLSAFFLFSCRTWHLCLTITALEHVKITMFTASITSIRP